MRPKTRQTRQIDQTLAMRLRLVRAALGLTQAELAARAQVPKASLSRVENGLTMPDLRTFQRLAEASGVAVGWLGTGHGAIFSTFSGAGVALAPSDRAPAFLEAVRLVSLSPIPLMFMLVDDDVGPDGLTMTAGLFVQPAWRPTRHCGVILPRLLSAYERMVWLDAWLAAGHRWLGLYRFRLGDVMSWSGWPSGALDADRTASLLSFWQSRIGTPSDHVPIDELERTRENLPPGQAARLEAAMKRIMEAKPGDPLAADLKAMIGEHPELVAPLWHAARQYRR